MATVLIILCALVWGPILLYQMDRRGFLVLLVWLAVAPVAVNVIQRPGVNPLLPRQVETEGMELGLEREKGPKELGYLTATTSIKLAELFDPTRLIFGAFFVVLLLEAAFHNRRTPLDTVEKWMVVFAIIAVIGALRSMRVLTSMRTAVDSFIVPFLAYYVTRRLVTSEKQLRLLTQVVVGVGCYLIITAVIERLLVSGPYSRLGSTFGNYNPLATLMAIVFIIMLANTLGGPAPPEEKQPFPHSVRWFVLYLAPVIVLLTWNRGSWVGFLMGAGIFLFLSRRLTSPARKLVLIGLMMIGLAVVVLVLQLPVLQPMIEERVTQRTGSIYARIGAWVITLQETIKAPVFGIGLNDMREALYTTRTVFMGQKSETHVHNAYLTFLAELGIVGLLAYLAIVAAIIRIGLRLYQQGTQAQDRWRGATVVAIMVAYLLPAMVANTLYGKELSHTYIYAFIGGIAGFYGQPLLDSKPHMFPGRGRQTSPGIQVIVR
jgi:O-antigen ligase